MNDSHDLLKTLRDFEETEEGTGYELRLDVADIVLRHLDEKQWTQTRLAEAAKMRPSYLTRVIHSSTNCTLDTAGRIFFALGVKVKLVEIESSPSARVKACQTSANTMAYSSVASSPISLTTNG